MERLKPYIAKLAKLAPTAPELHHSAITECVICMEPPTMHNNSMRGTVMACGGLLALCKFNSINKDTAITNSNGRMTTGCNASFHEKCWKNYIKHHGENAPCPVCKRRGSIGQKEIWRTMRLCLQCGHECDSGEALLEHLKDCQPMDKHWLFENPRVCWDIQRYQTTEDRLWYWAAVYMGYVVPKAPVSGLTALDTLLTCTSSEPNHAVLSVKINSLYKLIRNLVPFDARPKLRIIEAVLLYVFHTDGRCWHTTNAFGLLWGVLHYSALPEDTIKTIMMHASRQMGISDLFVAVMEKFLSVHHRLAIEKLVMNRPVSIVSEMACCFKGQEDSLPTCSQCAFETVIKDVYKKVAIMCTTNFKLFSTMKHDHHTPPRSPVASPQLALPAPPERAEAAPGRVQVVPETDSDSGIDIGSSDSESASEAEEWSDSESDSEPEDPPLPLPPRIDAGDSYHSAIQTTEFVVRELAVSRDRKMAVGCTDGRIRFINTHTMAVTLTINAHSGEIKSLVFSPNGAMLASGGVDNRVQVWDAVSGQSKLTLLQTDYSIVPALCWLDNRRLLSSNKNHIVSWNIQTGRRIKTLQGLHDEVTCIANRSGLVFAGDRRGRIMRWDSASMGIDRVVHGYLVMDRNAAVHSIAMDGTRKVIACAAGKVFLFDDYNPTIQFEWEVTDIQKVQVIDRHTLIGVSRSGIYEWDPDTGAETKHVTMPENSNPYAAAALWPDKSNIYHVARESGQWHLYNWSHSQLPPIVPSRELAIPNS